MEWNGMESNGREERRIEWNGMEQIMIQWNVLYKHICIYTTYRLPKEDM